MQTVKKDINKEGCVQSRPTDKSSKTSPSSVDSDLHCVKFGSSLSLPVSNANGAKPSSLPEALSPLGVSDTLSR